MLAMFHLRRRQKNRRATTKEGSNYLHLREFDIITQGQRSKTYGRGQHARANGHAVSFLGRMVLPEMAARIVQRDL